LRDKREAAKAPQDVVDAIVDEPVKKVVTADKPLAVPAKVAGEKPVRYESSDIRGVTIGPEDVKTVVNEPRELKEGEWCGVYVAGEKPGTFTQVEYQAKLETYDATKKRTVTETATRPLVVPFTSERVIMAVPSEKGTDYLYMRPTTSTSLMEEKNLNSVLANMEPGRRLAYAGMKVTRLTDESERARLEGEGYRVVQLQEMLRPKDRSRDFGDQG
jgi:hypothetical protein